MGERAVARVARRGRTTSAETARRRRRTVVAVTTALMLACVRLTGAPSASADSRFVDVEPLGSSDVVVAAVTPQGVTAGHFSDAANGGSSGFIRQTDGTFDTFRIENSSTTIVNDLNSAGGSVGYFLDGNVRQGFLRNADGSVVLLPLPGTVFVELSGINSSGTVVGTFFDDDGNAPRGIVREPAGDLTVLDAPNGVDTRARAINDAGAIAGTTFGDDGILRGFLRSAAGTYTRFAAPGGGNIVVTDIDDDSTVVGYFVDDGGNTVGFVRSAAGIFTPVSVGSGTDTRVTGIDDGTVVGTFLDGAGQRLGFVGVDGVNERIEVPDSTETAAAAIAGDFVVGQYVAAGSNDRVGYRFSFDTPAPDTQRPSPPRGLRGEAVGDEITLSWTTSTDDVAVTSYQIQRSTDGSLGPVVATIGARTTFTDTDVVPGETYTYAVRALDAADNRSWRSNLRTVTANNPDVGVDNERPSPPRGLRTEVRPWGILITWRASTDNVGVDEYIIFRSTDGTAGTAWRFVDGDTLRFDNGGAEPGVTYTFTVRAVDEAGNISWRSNLSSATR